MTQGQSTNSPEMMDNAGKPTTGGGGTCLRLMSFEAILGRAPSLVYMDPTTFRVKGKKLVPLWNMGAHNHKTLDFYLPKKLSDDE